MIPLSCFPVASLRKLFLFLLFLDMFHFYHIMIMSCLGLTILANVKQWALYTFVSDPNNWINTTLVTFYFMIDNILYFLFGFTFFFFLKPILNFFSNQRNQAFYSLVNKSSHFLLNFLFPLSSPLTIKVSPSMRIKLIVLYFFFIYTLIFQIANFDLNFL